MSSKSIVRDVHVTVERVDATPSLDGSTAYVFTVLPRAAARASTNHRASSRRPRVRHRSSMSDLFEFDAFAFTADRRYSEPSMLDHHTTARSAFTHQVSRTYAECRRLYKDLRAFTDCRDMATCCCILGSCPFWSMYTALKKFAFPRRSLLALLWTRTAVQRQRVDGFNRFMALVFQQFQRYRDDYFLDRVSTTEFHGCKVIAALEEFLDLHEDVVLRFREAERMMQLRMNLKGWRSDRKNLYFGEDDGEAEEEEMEMETVSQRRSRRRQRHVTDNEDSMCDSAMDTAGVDVDAILEGMRRNG